MHRYLFLDIDGVLNTERYRNYLLKNGLSETDDDGYLFDPDAVEWLEYILEETNAKIVVTSSWRLNRDIQTLWRNRKLPGEIIGVTPQITPYDVRFRSKKFICIQFDLRGIEIDRWLDENAITPYKYAIIKCKEEHSDEHLILTNPMTGIIEETADKVIGLLI